MSPLVAAVIVLGVIAVICAIGFCWAAWNRGNQAEQNQKLREVIAEREAERDQARHDHLMSALNASEWRGTADLWGDLYELAEADAQQARLERDDAHTSLNLVLAELEQRERKAVVFAAPTLAEAVL